MKHLDLFSGIGGFAFAADQVWPQVQHEFVEIDPFCRRVLKKHWPNAKQHDDIKTYHPQRPDTVDLVTGGFPCQPFSRAGHRRGTEDDRDLWPEMRRVISEARPRWVIGENVANFAYMALERTFADLEALHYEVQPFIIPACAVEASHERARIWIVAHDTYDVGRRIPKGKVRAGRHSALRADSVPTPYPVGHRDHKSEQDIRQGEPVAVAHHRAAANADRIGHEGLESQSGEERYRRAKANQRRQWGRQWPQVAAQLCRMDDGLPAELDGHTLSPAGHRNKRIFALGNAIVPWAAVEVMRAIKAADQT